MTATVVQDDLKLSRNMNKPDPAFGNTSKIISPGPATFPFNKTEDRHAEKLEHLWA